MLLVYNYVLLKMSTWYSKHVEESNNILRINKIQCITLVILYDHNATYQEYSKFVLAVWQTTILKTKLAAEKLLALVFRISLVPASDQNPD